MHAEGNVCTIQRGGGSLHIAKDLGGGLDVSGHLKSLGGGFSELHLHSPSPCKKVSKQVTVGDFPSIISFAGSTLQSPNVNVGWAYLGKKDSLASFNVLMIEERECTLMYDKTLISEDKMCIWQEDLTLCSVSDNQGTYRG